VSLARFDATAKPETSVAGRALPKLTSIGTAFNSAGASAASATGILADNTPAVSMASGTVAPAGSTIQFFVAAAQFVKASHNISQKTVGRMGIRRLCEPVAAHDRNAAPAQRDAMHTIVRCHCDAAHHQNW
jgi:hypothetical protein